MAKIEERRRNLKSSIEKKIQENEQANLTFKPEINYHSRQELGGTPNLKPGHSRRTSSQGKVEDRLISQGNVSKLKKDQIAEQNQHSYRPFLYQSQNSFAKQQDHKTANEVLANFVNQIQREN
jgi:hypothetical protein